MAEPLLIGIDAGTSVIKAVAFALDGRQIADAAVPNAYVTLPDGGAEQDMARTWADTVAVLRLLGQKITGLEERVVAVAVTGQGDGCWLVNKSGEPVAPAWLWLDGRAAEIAESFKASSAYTAHFGRTGTGITPCQQSAQLAWMKRNRPGLLEKAISAHHCQDWLYLKLTGVRCVDPSQAHFTYGNFRSLAYQPDVLDAMGAGELKRLLPPIVDGAAENHPLTDDAARATGLKSGTPIVLGYVDVMCSGLGGGLFDRDGQVGCTILGSTGMHMRMLSTASVRLPEGGTGFTMCVPEEGLTAQIQSNMAATLNIDWLLDLGLDVLASQGLDRTRKDFLAGLDERVLAAEPGRLIYHPYVSLAGERGPFLDGHARAGFAGIEQGMGFADLMRGVFEGLAHASRDCYAAIGGAPADVRVTGGAARSQALRLILASALKAKVRTVARAETGAAGAVMIAAVQQKIFPDMAAAVKAWVEPVLGEATEPDAALAARFDSTFPLYKTMREHMPPIWRGLQESKI